MDRDGDPELAPIAPLVSATAEPHASLGAAGSAAWRYLLPLATSAGYLTELDMPLFLELCELFDEIAECKRVIAENPGGKYMVAHNKTPCPLPATKELRECRKQRLALLDRFWLNPTARAGKEVKRFGVISDYDAFLEAKTK